MPLQRCRLSKASKEPTNKKPTYLLPLPPPPQKKKKKEKATIYPATETIFQHVQNLCPTTMPMWRGRDGRASGMLQVLGSYHCYTNFLNCNLMTAGQSDLTQLNAHVRIYKYILVVTEYPWLWAVLLQSEFVSMHPGLLWAVSTLAP